ncbi:MAG: twin-arginine translocase subunit TatC, partial [Chloroflexi bacterium]|nr:twin-arginine translocase subunit TatC [Chloroflexota bacterium]
ALSLPLIAYQVIRFMAPGLTRQEKRLLYTALPFIALLFVAGSAFAVFLVLPAMLGFLRGFMEMVFRNDFRAAATVSMALTMMLWMGLVFQMPLVMLILARLRIVHWRRLLSWWRYAVLLIMVAAAIITPTPDPVNMLIVAVPMIVLYALGVLLARLFGNGQPSSLPTSVPA